MSCAVMEQKKKGTRVQQNRNEPNPRMLRTESTHVIYSLWKSWRETTAYHIRRKKNNHNDTLLIRSQVGHGRTMRVDSLCLSSSLNYCREKILCVVSQGILFHGTNDNHKRGCGSVSLFAIASRVLPHSLWDFLSLNTMDSIRVCEVVTVVSWYSGFFSCVWFFCGCCWFPCPVLAERLEKTKASSMDHPRLVQAIGHLCFFGLFVAGDKLGWGHDSTTVPSNTIPTLVLLPWLYGAGLVLGYELWFGRSHLVVLEKHRIGKGGRCICRECELGQEQSLGYEITSPAFASTISSRDPHVVCCDFSLLADSYVLPAGMREMTSLPNWHQKHKNKPYTHIRLFYRRFCNWCEPLLWVLTETGKHARRIVDWFSLLPIRIVPLFLKKTPLMIQQPKLLLYTSSSLSCCDERLFHV